MKDFKSMAMVGPYTTDSTQRVNSTFNGLRIACIKGLDTSEAAYTLACVKLILAKVEGGCSLQSAKTALEISELRAKAIKENAGYDGNLQELQVEILTKSNKGQSTDEYLENLATFKLSKHSKLNDKDLDYTDAEILSYLGL